MLTRIVSVAGIVLVFFMVAGAVNIAEAGDPGTVVVAMGGGSLQDVAFSGDDVYGDATFSFFVGYDKKGNLKGSFFVKRVSIAKGVRAAISTEITDLEVEQEGHGCPWMTMSGNAVFKAYWDPKGEPGYTFTLEAWDCDSRGKGADMILLTVDGRPALTLVDPTVLDGGNIMIPYPDDLYLP